MKDATDMPPHALFDTPPERAFDRLTDLASTLLGVPVALLSLVDDRRQFFKSMTGLSGWAADARETPLSHSFCQHVVARGEALVVEDAREHPIVRGNGAIADLGVIAYLGEPVHSRDGRALGSFCAIDDAPRQWSERDRTVLRTLADAVDAEIGLRETLVEQTNLIAELSAANEALEAARADADTARSVAERALDERTRVFAALGHELRTPLNGIFGGLSLLGSTQAADKRALYAQMIRDSGQTLMTFVDHVVDYAGAAGGAIVPQNVPFDPMSPANTAVRTCAAYAESKGLRLLTPSTSRPMAPCVGDEALVAKILTNLLGNAVKFTAYGTVSVSVEQHDESTVWSVSDTGPGVPDEARARIFEPFDRGDAKAAAKASGSGLGLSVARLTAEAMGGTLMLAPSTGSGGAVFRLSLRRNGDERAGG